MVIKWCEELRERVEGGGECGLGKRDREMGEVVEVGVEWKVILVFVEEDLGEDGGRGERFVKRRRWKGRND